MPTVCLMLSSFIHWPASLLCWIYGCLLRVSCKEQRVEGPYSPTFYSISPCGWEHFPLQFRPPCHRRHPRISKKILENIKVVGGQINWYFQIFSDVLRYTAKRLGAFLLAVLAASSQATSKNIKEYFRRYKGYQLINKFISFPKKMLQARAPLLGNRRSLFVERAKRGKQWVGGGFSIIHEECIQQPHILRSRIYVNSFQQTLQFPWIDWRIQNESLPHAKCAPYFNELQSIDSQTITWFKTNRRLISHREMLQFASNHLLICTISSRILMQTAR